MEKNLLELYRELSRREIEDLPVAFEGCTETKYLALLKVEIELLDPLDNDLGRVNYYVLYATNRKNLRSQDLERFRIPTDAELIGAYELKSPLKLGSFVIGKKLSEYSLVENEDSTILTLEDWLLL